MDLKKLEKRIEKLEGYRTKQIIKAIYADFISDWDNVTVLPKVLREELNNKISLKINAKINSSKGKTIKAVIEFPDTKQVETVLIRHDDGRNTLCVSSQVGCPLGCTFCATGKMGFTRNLTKYEIIEQVLFFERFLKKENKKISNIVFMGMGEPFLNYENVINSIKILNDPHMFNIGARHISISTSGIIDGINKLAKEKLQINLAISLHSPTDKERSKIMPINLSQSLTKMLNAVDKYIEATNRKVMFEYLLISGVNDSQYDAKALAKLMKKPLYLVNLIKYNETGKYKPSKNIQIIKFKNTLKNEGINFSQRYSYGADIDAACGQLIINTNNK